MYLRAANDIVLGFLISAIFLLSLVFTLNLKDVTEIFYIAPFFVICIIFTLTGLASVIYGLVLLTSHKKH